MNEITEIVHKIFGDYVGYAIEAGAFDGVYSSTTFELEKEGWKVLLIEPIPEVFNNLLKNRNNDYCLQFALGDSNEDNVNFEVYAYAGGAGFSSFSISQRYLDVFGENMAGQKTDIIVDKRTLDFCLYLVNFPRVDILSLDVEGSELEVLRGFDIDRWKPKLLIIENMGKDLDEYRNHLKDYSLINRIGYNDIMLIKDGTNAR